MKDIEARGIKYIRLVPDGTDEWYYGVTYEHGDIYEAEERYKMGGYVKGRQLGLFHYPDGKSFWPVPKEPWVYPGEPIYYDGAIYILVVRFRDDIIQILKFDPEAATADESVGDTEEVSSYDAAHNVEVYVELPLSIAKDCYNLALDIAPLTLTRQCVGTNEFEILWPERVTMHMDSAESFFLRDGDKLFFNRWYEDPDYREETIVRNLQGDEIERFDGTVMTMPGGEIWKLQ